MRPGRSHPRRVRRGGAHHHRALLHDPGWLAVGPTGRRTGAASRTRYHRAAIGVDGAHGGPIYGAFRDGRLAGVAATFAAGRYPPPARTFLATSPASSPPGRRRSCAALRTRPSRTAAIPRGPHVFLWFLAVDPGHQRAGRRPGAAARCSRRPGARLPRHRQPGQPALLRELRLRGDRLRRPAARRDDVVHEASLSVPQRCASGRPSSFFSVLFSIWRMRSRVTPNARPTSSSVRAWWPLSP